MLQSLQGDLESLQVDPAKVADPRLPFAASRDPMKKGSKSISNGSMMRVTPLAVWCSNLSNKEIEMAVTADASFTHSNPLVHNIITVYCIGIKCLIQNAKAPSRAQLAYNAALEYAFKPGVDENLKSYLQESYDLLGKEAVSGFLTVKTYKCQERGSGPNSECFCKHGLTLAFYCLLKSQFIPIDDLYDFSMRQVSRLGGDTDTNCAIVGGMIGAYVGLA